MSFEKQRLAIPDFAVLSPKAAVRLRSLDRAAFDVNLPANAKDSWRQILAERALNDDEVDSFYNEIRNTPVHLIQTIRSEIRKGKSTISSLVPVPDCILRGLLVHTMEVHHRRLRVGYCEAIL